MVPHICFVPTFLAASVPPGAAPPEIGASARDSRLEEVSKSRSRDPELPVSGPRSRVVRLKAMPTPALRVYLHKYIPTRTKCTPNLTFLTLSKLVSLSREEPSIQTHELSGDISYSGHNRNHITYKQRCVGRLCTENSQFLLF